MTVNTPDILKQVMAKRTAAGLRLEFEVPGRDDCFVCYPKDIEQRELWIDRGFENGWTLIDA